MIAKVPIENLTEMRKVEFFKQMNYLDESRLFIFDKDIYEYDIKQANIHALHAIGKLTLTEFRYYASLPKLTREVAIGNMIKSNHGLYHDIQYMIGEAKYEFAAMNGLQESDILRIANDSLYIVSPYKELQTTVVKNGVPLRFVCKNHFRNYMRLSKKILFFCNTNGEYWDIDIKGISSDKIEKHQEFLSRLCGIVDAKLNGGTEIAIYKFNELYSDYVNRRLPISCYRELNSDSMYRVTGSQSYLLSEIDPYSRNLPELDINYNLNILRTVYSYIMQS